jgi:enoyl-CoA hydratase/carnithine racemase
LTGDRLSAKEAYRIGLISRIVPAADLLETATTFASRLALLPPVAVQATKRALNQYLAAAETPVFELALAAESISFDTIEHREAIEHLAASSSEAGREHGNGNEKAPK